MTASFDRKLAEKAIEHYLQPRIGWVSMFECEVDGVVAFEEIDSHDKRKVDFDGFARHLSEALGIRVLNVARTTWSFTDDCDSDAHYVAFDIPGLDQNYLDEYKCELSEAYLEALEQDEAPVIAA